jgi:hypothetical protein
VFTSTTRIVARFFVGKRIAAGFRVLGLGKKRGAKGFKRTDGGRMMRLFDRKYAA